MIEKHAFFELLFLLFFGFFMVVLECSECKNVAKYFESLGKCSERSLFRIRLLRMGKKQDTYDHMALNMLQSLNENCLAHP